jgi:hypothetical protein
MKYFQKAIFDLPKRPINGFILYYKNNVNEIKENKKNLLIKDVAKIISEKWNKENIMVHKKYNSMAKADIKRFKIELKQFEKLGYYVKVDINDIIKNKNSDKNAVKLLKKINVIYLTYI